VAGFDTPGKAAILWGVRNPIALVERFLYGTYPQGQGAGFLTESSPFRLAGLRIVEEDMMNKAHLKILRKGVAAWNTWREKNPHIIPDLSGADLSGMDLRGINFSKANLRRVNLRGANLGPRERP